MRDEAEQTILRFLNKGGWMTTLELVKAGAGKFSVICATLERLRAGGFVRARLSPIDQQRDGDNFLGAPPCKEYGLTDQGMWFVRRE